MPKDDRQVLRGIGVHENDKFRAMTDEDEIARSYSQDELNAYVDADVLSGTWTSTKVIEAPEVIEQPKAAPKVNK